MENASITYKTTFGKPNTSTLSELTTLYTTIFEDADVPFFLNRINQHPKLFTALAYTNNLLVGFKIGYPKTNTIFYSWIGGILPEYRNKGIAMQLAQLQEEHAKEQRFTILSTKSMNCFKPMMILNLKRGFNITKIYTNTKGQTKVVFEKAL
jgi:predicted GNAT superfamily acetyltransferase